VRTGEGFPGPEVLLRAVDEDVLEHLVAAALDGAAAGEVPPPVTPGGEWTPERVEWLRTFHRSRRAGLDGTPAEATWAVVAAGDVVGSIRLKRIAESKTAEIGLWLTRAVRGRGLGRRAVVAVLAEASARGLVAVRADTTAGNRPALGVLAALGFECTVVEDGAIIGWLALDD
jgi:RimJ/RimL family protein N-acetyltransferase